MPGRLPTRRTKGQTKLTAGSVRRFGGLIRAGLTGEGRGAGGVVACTGLAGRTPGAARSACGRVRSSTSSGSVGAGRPRAAASASVRGGWCGVGQPQVGEVLPRTSAAGRRRRSARGRGTAVGLVPPAQQLAGVPDARGGGSPPAAARPANALHRRSPCHASDSRSRSGIAAEKARAAAGTGVTGRSQRCSRGTPGGPRRPACTVGLRDAGWSSSVARWAHNPEVTGSNPVPATTARSPDRSVRASSRSGARRAVTGAGAP